MGRERERERERERDQDNITSIKPTKKTPPHRTYHKPASKTKLTSVVLLLWWSDRQSTVYYCLDNYHSELANKPQKHTTSE